MTHYLVAKTGRRWTTLTVDGQPAALVDTSARQWFNATPSGKASTVPLADVAILDIVRQLPELAPHLPGYLVDRAAAAAAKAAAELVGETAEIRTDIVRDQLDRAAAAALDAGDAAPAQQQDGRALSAEVLALVHAAPLVDRTEVDRTTGAFRAPEKFVHIDKATRAVLLAAGPPADGPVVLVMLYANCAIVGPFNSPQAARDWWDVDYNRLAGRAAYAIVPAMTASGFSMPDHAASAQIEAWLGRHAGRPFGEALAVDHAEARVQNLIQGRATLLPHHGDQAFLKAVERMCSAFGLDPQPWAAAAAATFADDFCPAGQVDRATHARLVEVVTAGGHTDQEIAAAYAAHSDAVAAARLPWAADQAVADGAEPVEVEGWADISAGPLYPAGTPEHAGYATELRGELSKWASGENPYPYAVPVVHDFVAGKDGCCDAWVATGAPPLTGAVQCGHVENVPRHGMPGPRLAEWPADGGTPTVPQEHAERLDAAIGAQLPPRT